MDAEDRAGGWAGDELKRRRMGGELDEPAGPNGLGDLGKLEEPEGLDGPIGATGVFSQGSLPGSGERSIWDGLATDGQAEPEAAGHSAPVAGSLAEEETHTGKEAAVPASVGMAAEGLGVSALDEPMVHRIVLEAPKIAAPVAEAEKVDGAVKRPVLPESEDGLPASTTVDANAGFTQLLRMLTEKATRAEQKGENAGAADGEDDDALVEDADGGLKVLEEEGREVRTPSIVQDAGFTSLLKTLRPTALPNLEKLPAEVADVRAEVVSTPEQSSGFTALLRGSMAETPERGAMDDRAADRFVEGSLGEIAKKSEDAPGELTQLFSAYAKSAEHGAGIPASESGFVPEPRQSAEIWSEGSRRESGSVQEPRSLTDFFSVRSGAGGELSSQQKNEPSQMIAGNAYSGQEQPTESVQLDRGGESLWPERPGREQSSQPIYGSSFAASDSRKATTPTGAPAAFEAGVDGQEVGITRLLNLLETPTEAQKAVLPLASADLDAERGVSARANEQTFRSEEEVRLSGSEAISGEESEVTRILKASKFRELAIRDAEGGQLGADGGLAPQSGSQGNSGGPGPANAVGGWQPPPLALPNTALPLGQGLAGHAGLAGQVGHIGQAGPGGQVGHVSSGMGNNLGKLAQVPQASTLPGAMKPKLPDMPASTPGKLQQLTPILLIAAIFLLLLIVVILLFLLKH